MAISVDRTGSDTYRLTIDRVEATVDGNGLKALLLQITQILLPGAHLGGAPRQRAREVLGRIKTANDVGLQALIRVVDHDDVLVLLKVGESDSTVMERLYANMSERMRKMCVEDMLFKFKDGIGDDVIGEAMGRIGRKAADLEIAGTLTYG